MKHQISPNLKSFEIGYLSPFVTLQGLHRKVRFSHTVQPPRVYGVMWSASSCRKPAGPRKTLLQSGQTYPPRSSSKFRRKYACFHSDGKNRSRGSHGIRLGGSELKDIHPQFFLKDVLPYHTVLSDLGLLSNVLSILGSPLFPQAIFHPLYVELV